MPGAEIDADYFQRHPRWTSNVKLVRIPVTELSEASDYFQCHPEHRPLAETTDFSDYFLRH